MSAGAIQAGKAWVEMAIRDKVGPGLAAVQKKLTSWGAGLAGVGGVMSAAAGAVIAPLMAAAKAFADSGSQIHDMSQATGVGAESLSALKYAAEQSGASVDDVGAAMKGMAKFTLALKDGGEEATDTLKTLGLSANDFLAASPEKRLEMVAEALTHVEDPGLKAAYAMKLLGKGGAALLPMLSDGAAGLQAMTDQARAFNLTTSEEGAAKADALGDAWDLANSVLMKVWKTVGEAVAPTLTELFMTVAKIGAGVIEWIGQNQALIVTMFKWAAAAAGVGAALVAVGAALPLIAAAIGFLTSPIGIVSSLLAAGAGYFTMYTDTGKSVLGELIQAFTDLYTFIKSIVGGIFDALVAGNWELAGKIVIAALKLAWQTGIGGLKLLWVDFKTWILKMLATVADAIADFLGPLGKWLGLEDFAKEVKTGADLLRNEQQDSVGKKTLAAQAELDKLLAEARAARVAKDDMFAAAADKNLKKTVQVGAPIETKTQLQVATGGTFSALGANQISNREFEVQRETAEYTKEIMKLMAKVERNTRLTDDD
jgi:hypothetical protein